MLVITQRGQLKLVKQRQSHVRQVDTARMTTLIRRFARSNAYLATVKPTWLSRMLLTTKTMRRSIIVRTISSRSNVP